MIERDLYELGIIALILFGIGFVVWRTGQANPVSTGGLDRKLAEVDGELKKLGGDVGGIKEKVEDIESRVEDIDSRAAKVADIKRVERQLGALEAKFEQLRTLMAEQGEEAAARREKVDQTARQVDLLYQHIVSKGMNA